jgi:hypothetical protein
MFYEGYHTKKYNSDKYWWYGAIVVTGVDFRGAYAVIVRYRPSGPTLVFDALRGVTVDLDKTAVAEDADPAVIETIGKTSTITSRPTGSIERVK